MFVAAHEQGGTRARAVHRSCAKGQPVWLVVWVSGWVYVCGHAEFKWPGCEMVLAGWLAVGMLRACCVRRCSVVLWAYQRLQPLTRRF